MRIRRFAPIVAAALLIAPLSACAMGSGSSESTPEIGIIEPSRDASFTAELDGSTSAASAERSVIRSGDLMIEVGDPVRAASEASEVAEQLDGYVESESLGTGEGGQARTAHLLLRVPAERLDDAFDALGELGTVLSQQRSASDVTTQHVDLQARVEALEASVARLTELMSGSATTGELIEAETALSQRQQELDGLRAQLEALEGQVDMASISVSLTTKTTLPGGPNSFWDGLVAGWDSLVAAGAGALVVLGILLPWLAIAAIIAVIIIAIVRSRRRARRTSGGTHGNIDSGSSYTGAPSGD